VYFDPAKFDLVNAPAMLDHVLSGSVLGPMLGHSAESLEVMYYFGHTFFRNGKYAEALKLFSLLLICDHLDRRYYMGMGACLQMQEQHADALKYYRIASLLDLTDPASLTHGAECSLALGDTSDARKALDYALVQAKAHERHHEWIDRVEGRLALLDGAISTST
jgi:type III secretion system low calcium response chaperone LcrH/SycD